MWSLIVFRGKNGLFLEAQPEAKHNIDSALRAVSAIIALHPSVNTRRCVRDRPVIYRWMKSANEKIAWR